ncbi:hypothetical protein CU633_20935 [Bacillus sp. V3-13]|uniref:hypothetical protein n=1 Tax=Bacillus sp. V3-13 TaxID=2053728 RepID=UPI000C758E37|nr:hypothetical protein [Bacillus sp. V3-13]PLR75432.1 hypothetical protein CU633_20935 [Bacillus sp. V3-13]
MGKQKILNFKLFSIIICICLFNITACDNLIVDNNESSDNEKMGGFEFNYNLPNLTQTPMVHKIDEEHDYTASVEVINHFSEKSNFRLFIFLDNKITSIEQNKKKVNYIDISLDKGEGKNYTFSINNIQKGRHELIALLVLKPDIALTKKEFIDYVNFSKRFIVIAGEENIVQKNKKELISIDNKSQDEAAKITYITPADSINTPDNAITLINEEKNEKRATLHFWNDSPNKSYTILGLSNNKQIKVEQQNILVKNVGQVSIDINIPMDKTLKTNNIIFLIVENMDSTPDHPSEGIQSTNKITILSEA